MAEEQRNVVVGTGEVGALGMRTHWEYAWVVLDASKVESEHISTHWLPTPRALDASFFERHLEPADVQATLVCPNAEETRDPGYFRRLIG